MIDLHVHTWRCRHARGTAEAYVRAAAERGVGVLAFTEHLPLPPVLADTLEGAEGYAMPAGELPHYVAEVQAAAVLGLDLGVEVLLGVEADLVTDGIEHARSIVERLPLDVVLGSVHTIDGWAFDDPDRMSGYDSWDIADLWERYFADLAVAARSGLADVIAHADLVKKFCGRPASSVDHLYTQTAAALAEAGVAVEVNTAGLRKPCRELYPAIELLTALRRAGVPVTVGSDAHDPGDVGAGRTEAIEALEAAGYRSVLVFRRRVAEEVGIDAL